MTDLAVRMAREIQYKINGWNVDLKEAEMFPSKTPTRRDRDRHEAWLSGALTMLSVELYGDAVHMPEARAYVESAPWTREGGGKDA